MHAAHNSSCEGLVRRLNRRQRLRVNRRRAANLNEAFEDEFNEFATLCNSRVRSTVNGPGQPAIRKSMELVTEGALAACALTTWRSIDGPDQTETHIWIRRLSNFAT